MKDTKPYERTRLFAPSGSGQGEEHSVGAKADIGRSSENDIVIQSRFVSNRHARLEYIEEEGAYQLKDLGSQNGVWLDGRRLTRPRKLADLHVIGFPGGLEYIFQILPEGVEYGEKTADGLKLPQVAPLPSALQEESREEAQRPEPKTVIEQIPPTPSLPGEPGASASSREAAPASSTDDVSEDEPMLPTSAPDSDSADDATTAEPISPTPALPAGPGAPEAPAVPSASAEGDTPSGLESDWVLLVQMDDGTACSYPLRQGENRIGRGPDNEVRIDHPTMGRRQASILVEDGKAVLVDHGAVNPTQIDGKPLTEPTPVKLGQSVVLGQVKGVLVPRGADTNRSAAASKADTKEE